MAVGIILLIANLFLLNTALGQNYYYKGSGLLNDVTRWGLNTDGTGAAPANFTTAGRTFNVRNTSAVSNSGTWTVSGAGSKIVVGDGTNATNLTIPTGANTIVATIDVSAAATLTLSNTSIPTFGTLNTTSTVVYNATSAQTITAVTYGNLTYSGSSTGTFGGSCNITGSFLCSSGSVTFNSSNPARTFGITGNFTMSSSGGTLEFGGGNGSSTINLSGNFSKTNGYMVTTTAAANADFNMVGTSQTIQSTGGTVMKWIDFTIASGSICTLNGDYNINGSSGTPAVFTVSSGGTFNTGGFSFLGTTTPSGNNSFVLNSGGNLGIGSANGITSAGTASGSIQALVRTFNVGGNYIYNGTGNQNTGTGLPTNLTGNLTINNPGNTVTLSVARTIANGGSVNLTDGIFASANILTMSSTSTINRTAGSMSGTPQGAGIYNVNYTGNSKTTGSELSGSGLNNVNENLTSGQTLTLGAAITMDGALTLAAGTTLEVSGSNFAINIAGNWTNNGATFSSGTGTVTFNGTGSQSINGTAATQAFNNVVVNKTAGQLLNTGGSTTTVTTNALTLTQGNFTGPSTLNITGNFLHTAGTFTAGTNTNVSGNWTRNGGTFTAGSNTVTFTGSSAQIINGSNSTAFNILTINKTAAANSVTSQTTAFTAAGNLTVTQGNLILTATDANYAVTGNLSVAANGTLSHNVDWDVAGKQLNVGGNITINGVYSHSVPRSHVQMTGTSKTLNTGTSSLSIVTLAGATVTANGPVTITDNFWAPFNTSGSFSTGGQTVIASGSLLVSGGTVNVNGGSLTVSGGVLLGSGTSSGNLNESSGTFVTDGITLGDVASTSASTITQSGGTFTVNGAVTINQPTAGFNNAWNINAQSATVSGLITFAGAATSTNRVGTIVLTTGTLNANGGITFAGTIVQTKVINLGTTGTVNLKGALTGATAATLTAGTSGSIFNYNDNTTAQSVNFFGAGAYHNLHINTTGGAGATLSAGITAANVTGNLRVLTGTLENGGFAIAGNAARTFEVANGAFFKLTGTTSAFPTVFGTITLGATGTVNYAGSGAQIVSPQSYGNLTTSNTSSLTMSGNSSVATTLTFTSGKIITGANTLTLLSGASISGAGTGKYVFGNLAWTFPTGTPTRVFEIGDVTNYTPLTVAYTTSISTGGTLTASTSAGDHPNIAGSGFTINRTVNRTWTLTNTGILPATPGYSAIFNFIGPTPGSGDIDALATPSNFIVKRFNGSWNATTVGTRTATSTQATAIDGYGDFQVGDGCTPPVINTPAVTNISCNASTDGAIDITTTGGSTPFTYAWTGPGGFTASTEDITGLAPGNYSLLITATGGCTVSSGTITVTEPAVLNATVGSTNVDCNGASTGTISITSPTGGYGNYEYTINGGGNWQSSGNFTGLAAGTYDVQIRDADHITCMVSLNAALIITELAVLNATLNTVDASCGINDGSITFTSPTGGSGSYEYTINGGTNWQSSPAFTGLAAGSYNVQIRDAAHTSCVVILDNDHIVNQASVPDAPTSGGNQTVCSNGDPEQTITATATSGATITWYDAATAGNIVSPPSLEGIGTVTYYAEASSGSCVSTTRTAVTLTIQESPAAPVSGGDETVCSNGSPTQTLIATASSPNTITWYDAATAGNIVTPALIGVGTATYYAEASNGDCPSASRTPVTLTINPVLATPGTITGPLDVCPLVGSPTPSVYSIDPVSGATFYTWTVPPGATIVAGQGTTDLSVTFDNSYAFTNQFFRVDAEAPGACTSGLSSLEVLKVLPGIPTVINGPTDACPYIGQPTNAVYSIAPVTGATSYTWTVSGNATLVSGQGTLSIEVSFLTGFTTGSIKVAANSNCGSRAPRSLNVAKLSPAAPAAISGPTDACAYIGTATQVNYSIAPVANATSYNWLVPANVTLVSGQGTTSIMVTFNAGYTASLIRVRSVSSCANSGYQSLSVGAAVTTIPGIISGPTNACQFIGTGLEATYTIRKVVDANSYIWSVPTGASITSHPAGAGVNDTIVTVSYNNSFVSGTDISVQAVSCLPSAARTLTITRTLIAQPGLISTVSINVCPYMVSATNPTGTPVVYTIRKMAATSYNWTAPAGATITNHPNGPGVNDTIVEITYGSGFTSGNVTVSATNNCGAGPVRSLGIISLRPGAVGGITTAQTASCPNREYSYTVASYPTNGNSILWTVPAGGTILSGQGTLSITVSYTSGAINGTVTATGYNNCGNSPAPRSINIKLTACGGRGTTGKETIPATSVVPFAEEQFKVNMFPNPTVSDFKLQVVTADKEIINVRILDMQGRQLKNITVMPYLTINVGADLKAGTYMVEVVQGKNKTTEKLLKF